MIYKHKTFAIDMSSVVVFVFLLDNLAGFNNALNDTLISGAIYAQNNEPPDIQNCDPVTTEQILSAVSQDLDLDIVPTFRTSDNNNYNPVETEQLREQSPEEVYNTMVDNSLHEVDPKDEFYQKQLDGNVYDTDFTPFYRRSHLDHPENDHKAFKPVEDVTRNFTKIQYPKTAPFLVAIFETLSNITAQTCAGTLLSPHWVLTAANCVDILSNLYNNGSIATNKSHYTVVAGSHNPLLDGSAHNVTSVLLHPEVNLTHPLHKGLGVDGPYLALMKIEPEAEVPSFQLIPEEAISGEVMVYGWILSKNETEHDSLNCTSMSGLILTSPECQAMYSYRANDVICLLNNDTEKNTTQLSSGGPVMMEHEGQVKLLAVVQTDEHLFVAYPLAQHIAWINQTIYNKS